MRIALVNGQRREPEPGLHGICQRCEQPLIAKCGLIRIHHWAHKADLICPYEREPETPWHRAWKSHFPFDWQERRFRSPTGELHIADVYSPEGKGMAVEFQHSPISLSERICREEIYTRMFWIVDGTRRQNDGTRFIRDWLCSDPSPENSLKRLVRKGRCALLRDWKDSRVPVFFDFGDPAIWSLSPVRQEGRMVLGITFRDKVIAAIKEGSLPKMMVGPRTKLLTRARSPYRHSRTSNRCVR